MYPLPIYVIGTLGPRLLPIEIIGSDVGTPVGSTGLQKPETL